MNLEEVIDKTRELIGVDENYRLGGMHENLRIEFINGRKSGHTIYIVKCVVCEKDQELHGEGYFKIAHGSLRKGGLPCGCGSSPKWSEGQYRVLMERRCQTRGHEFIDFAEDFHGKRTKCLLKCDKHGEWSTSNISNYLCHNAGCTLCRSDLLSRLLSYSEDANHARFMSSGIFEEGTTFWKSDREGNVYLWEYLCPVCQEIGQMPSGSIGSLQTRNCACNPTRPLQCYIFSVESHPNIIKIGRTYDYEQRLGRLSRTNKLQFIVEGVWKFKNSPQACNAESCVKRTLTPVPVCLEDFKHGASEIFSIDHKESIIKIYEQYGGVLLRV
jgi:hypothetical protein